MNTSALKLFRVQVAAVIERLEQELQNKDAQLREQQVTSTESTRGRFRREQRSPTCCALQVLHESQVLQKLQLQERLRDTQAKLVLQKQHDSGLHTLLSRSMDRLESTKDALMLADEHVTRYKM